MPQKPPEIEAALSALEKLSSELPDDNFTRLQKALPALARQMALAGEEVDANMLIDHVRQGEEHLAALKEQYGQKPKVDVLTYEDVVANFVDYQRDIRNAINTHNLDAFKAVYNNYVESHSGDAPFEALKIAANNGATSIMNYIFETSGRSGVYLGEVHQNDHLLLSATASHNHLETLKYLHKKFPEASLTNILIGAATYARKEIFDYCIDQGADIRSDEIKRSGGGLEIICGFGSIKSIKKLKQVDPEYFKDRLEFGFKDAAKNGNLEVVEYLLDQEGVDVNARDGLGLYYACEQGHVDVVQALRARGGSITSGEQAYVKFAAKSGCYNDAKTLYSEFANLDIVDLFAQAIKYGNFDVIQYCLDEGVDYRDFSFEEKWNGSTTFHPSNNALMVAARSNQKDVCLFFKKHDLEFYKASLTTALAVSGSEKHSDMTRFLLEEGADASDPSLWIVRDYALTSDYETIECLIERGTDVTAHDNEALITALRRNDFKMVKLLVENGAHTFPSSEREAKCASLGTDIRTLAYLIDNTSFDLEQHSLYLEPLETNIQKYRAWKEKFPDVEITNSLTYLNRFHFDVQTYKAVLPMLEKEGSEGESAVKYAYQAACLFKSEQRVLQYLQKWGQAGKQPLHDVIQNIQIPQAGRPDIKAWGDAVLKHGPKMAKFVKFSDRLAQPMKDKSGGWSYTKTKEEIAKHAYKRGAENPRLASFCLDHAWDDDDFDDALKQIEKFKKKYNPSDLPGAANDNIKGRAIPDISIKGEKFGKDGYTFRKLPDGDIRGLLLGEFTNCCQHLANAGRNCAKHGFKSPNGGFYVVEDDKTGDIVAQSWSWRGKQGELVFDSLESLNGHFNAEKWTSLCSAFSEKVVQIAKDTGITAFHVGKGGATPSIGFSKATPEAKPIDYDGYRDSKEQYLIASF